MTISTEKEQGKRNSTDLLTKKWFFQFASLQITQLLNQPEKLEEYTPQENELKILRSKCDTTSGNFLGLENCLAYLTVRGDFQEQFFDYGYSKENSKLLTSTHKMKVPNSFSSTIFNRHRIQYESGAFAETDSSNIFLFFAFNC